MDAGRRTAALGVATLVTGLLVVGCARGNRNDDAQWEARPVSTAGALEPPAAGGTSAPAASPTPVPASASAAPKPTVAAKKPAPVKPSRDPAKAAKELPPPPPPPKPNCSPSYSGPNADKRNEVRPALDAVAAEHFWYNSIPKFTVPKNLLYAVAWQESGWQSAILACDGGIGTMQVMPGTAEMMNRRFGGEHDVHTLKGNVMLGGQYLAWLVKYLGDLYFQSNYDLSAPAAPGSLSLLDSVVSAYNVGPGAVDPTKGRSGLENRQYVDNVEALMTNCSCLTF